MGEFGWSQAIAFSALALVYIVTFAKGWTALRDSLRDARTQAEAAVSALKSQVDALARDKVPVLECHDKHAAEREQNRTEHLIINGNLRRLSEQGIKPANPHPKIDPLPGQQWSLPGEEE